MLLKLISVLLFFGTGAGLLWYLLRGDTARREPKGALWAACGFGFLGLFIAAWTEMFLPGTQAALAHGAGFLFATTLAIGVIEESAKFVPLALYIRNKPYFNEHTDGIIYFVISGLTFGIAEDLVYTFAYSNGQPGGEYTGILRIVTGLFFHAASAGIIGYYLIKSKIHRTSWLGPATALGCLALVHATYDFLLFFMSGLSAGYSADTSDGTLLVMLGCMVGAFSISGMLNLCLFLYYRRAKQWDYSVGLAVDPNRVIAQQQYAAPPTVAVPMYAQQVATVPAAVASVSPISVMSPAPTQSIPVSYRE